MTVPQCHDLPDNVYLHNLNDVPSLPLGDGGHSQKRVIL